VLLCMDRMVSASLGRPCAIRDEEYEPSISSWFLIDMFHQFRLGLACGL